MPVAEYIAYMATCDKCEWSQPHTIRYKAEVDAMMHYITNHTETEPATKSCPSGSKDPNHQCGCDQPPTVGKELDEIEKKWNDLISEAREKMLRICSATGAPNFPPGYNPVPRLLEIARDLDEKLTQEILEKRNAWEYVRQMEEESERAKRIVSACIEESEEGDGILYSHSDEYLDAARRLLSEESDETMKNRGYTGPLPEPPGLNLGRWVPPVDVERERLVFGGAFDPHVCAMCGKPSANTICQSCFSRVG